MLLYILFQLIFVLCSWLKSNSLSPPLMAYAALSQQERDVSNSSNRMVTIITSYLTKEWEDILKTIF